MKPIDKLREILCEVDEIKEDLMESEILYQCNRDWKAWDLWTMTDDDFEEIENPIEERHLRMYCEKKGMDIQIIGNGIITIYNWPIPLITKLDNTKSLHNQSDEVIEKIINFLTENK